MFHSLTPLFSRNIYDRIILMNNHWNHYKLIQRIESGAFKSPVIRNVFPIENCYYNFPAPSTNKIARVIEYNAPTNFTTLVQYGGEVHYYKKKSI